MKTGDLTANIIRGGTLTIGGVDNTDGRIAVLDSSIISTPSMLPADIRLPVIEPPLIFLPVICSPLIFSAIKHIIDGSSINDIDIENGDVGLLVYSKTYSEGVHPVVDNYHNCGQSDRRWKTIFAGTSEINTPTSPFSISISFIDEPSIICLCLICNGDSVCI